MRRYLIPSLLLIPVKKKTTFIDLYYPFVKLVIFEELARRRTIKPIKPVNRHNEILLCHERIPSPNAMHRLHSLLGVVLAITAGLRPALCFIG